MEYIDDFFGFVNDECINVSIKIEEDSRVDIKWENINISDYMTIPQTINRINIRAQKTKNGAYFIDYFQNCHGDIRWYGFHIKACSQYEIKCVENNLFDAYYYFDNNQKLCAHKIKMEVVFVLHNFFNGFI